MLAVLFTTLALAAGPFFPFESPTDVRWAESPLAGTRVEFGPGGTVRAIVATPDLSVTARDRLWVVHQKWLEAQGYLPARRNHAAPWQRCRWQRFEREDGAIELDIRRRRSEGGWQVLILPRSGGSGGAPW